MRQRPFALLSLGLCLVAMPAMAAPAPKSKPPAVAPKPVEPDVTGLVIDARDLDYEPRMSPALYDDGAHNLLDGLSFDPEKVASDGFARWVRSYNPDEPNPRVGAKPMILKPLRVEGGDRLIFSAEDGSKLKVANSRDKFIDRMRILILY
ncbi:MAG TPA: hypothetical protein V6D05_14865 [Stenomitos sp.]